MREAIRCNLPEFSDRRDSLLALRRTEHVGLVSHACRKGEGAMPGHQHISVRIWASKYKFNIERQL